MAETRRYQFTLREAIAASFIAGVVIYLHVDPATKLWLLADSVAVGAFAFWRIDCLLDEPPKGPDFSTRQLNEKTSAMLFLLCGAGVSAVIALAKVIDQALRWYGV